ncbi:hypothetical protein [Sinorhizobium meliloti]|uniref:hypothetical protein n=1 Tax=Rhizobium meliloti TaxID=382 RepID=UPI001F2AB374|nr:hypothetical protein [Sinorhizobium meliloti]
MEPRSSFDPASADRGNDSGDRQACAVHRRAGGYEEAGGQVQRELFDDRNAGYAMDIAMVEKLVAEKLETAAATVRAEGWKWVECSATAPAGYHAMKHHYPEDLPLSEKIRRRLMPHRRNMTSLQS